MVKILGISGSLRAQSYNTALLKAAKALSSADVDLEVATLHCIPLYDGDVEERDGIPEAVLALKARILANQGLLLVTPEYNNGIPGVFKNAIDWLSRADGRAIFAGRAVAVIGASPGGFGTILSQNAWLPVLKTLGARQFSAGRLMLSRAHQVFTADGELSDENNRKLVRGFLQEFAKFI